MKKDEMMSYLFELTMEKEWKQVEDLYSKHSWLHDAKLTKNENTALHVAVLSYNSSESKRTGPYIEQMINNMSMEALSTKNKLGDTPLHLAAAAGWTSICRCIADRHWELITRRNRNNETPLFVAARHGKDNAFYILHKIYIGKSGPGEEAGDSLCRRSDGNTALHVAISGECFDLAKQIIKYYPKLVDDVNVLGESPLHVLAKKPNVFRSVNDLGFWDSLICKYALEGQTNDQLNKRTAKTEDAFPKNYRTCVNIFYFLWIPISSIIQASLCSRCKDQKEQNETRIDEENQQEREIMKASKQKTRSKQDVDDHYPPNWTTFVMLIKFAMNISLTIVGVGLGKIKKIEQHKMRYVKALKIVNYLLKYESSYKYVNDGQWPGQNTLNESPSRVQPPSVPPPDDGSPKSDSGPSKSDDVLPEPEEMMPDLFVRADTPIIVAAKLGIHEIVDKIFSKLHIAIVDKDSDGRNVLMLAAKHRQITVFNHLLDSKHIPEHVFHHVDNHGNNIIHLAAMLEERDKPWRISGAALQMQWEIKWFEYVKASVPSTCFTHHINAKGETPDVIFTQTHEKLMNQGYLWLIRTSESCSLTATLIAGVAFTTSASVPGGPNGDTGFPILEGHAAFNVFSISSLVALSLAITALVLFLAIITSRSVEQDFKSELPNKLLYGLTCLFASIAAMLVAFCAGHTFVLTDELKYVEIPIYSLACVPVALYFLAQLPLYVDLLSGVCRNVPVPSVPYI